MKLYGIIGFPVGHTASPPMQMAAFRAIGELGSVYMPFETSPNRLKEVVRSFRVLGIQGFNVTIPHKEKVCRFLDVIQPEAAMIGAVNTVKNIDGRLHGYNTDAGGFIQSLKEDLHFAARNKNCLVIGAGGAGRAVSFALAKAGVGAIYITDLDDARAAALAKNIRTWFPKKNVDSIKKGGSVNFDPFVQPKGAAKRKGHDEIDLIVNATPIGMKSTDPFPVNPSILHRGLSVYDVIYTPSPTKLVKKARSMGIPAVNGLGMLLYQGAIAFSIWTGRPAPVTEMRKALLRHIHKR
ncbi:MAG: shikimate dehydrogenase [Chlamydiota bacterium]|nr:shikimate dehydrogenase [Chlamydiota bacterium]